jgi:hypothetical protein
MLAVLIGVMTGCAFLPGMLSATNDLDKASNTPAQTVPSKSPDGEDLSAQLVGDWLEIDIDNIYTFNADGTGSEYYAGENWDMT